MRVLLYEWCCSGGLQDGDASIAHEGRMMLESIAADAAMAMDVTILVDSRTPLSLPPRAHTIQVRAGQDQEQLEIAARDADWTIIVAPESQGILIDRVRRVRAAGGRVLAPHERVIALCTDKQRTIDALAARGIPVPAGRSLRPGEPIPWGFRLPAIRKARMGCGCESLHVVSSCDTAVVEAPTRLEHFAAGIPVGVSLLCGPTGYTALPPMRQRFSEGNEPQYLGSDVLLDEDAAARATTLALRAARAIGVHEGWLGIDLVLGDRSDGRHDQILEINPRLTTSIVGQRALFATSLVAAMIEAANGCTPSLMKASVGPGAGSFSVHVD